jgi:hypothetical protein
VDADIIFSNPLADIHQVQGCIRTRARGHKYKPVSAFVGFAIRGHADIL